MIFVKRPPAPAYFSSPAMQQVVEELHNRYNSDSQQRIKFDMSLLTAVRSDIAAVFPGKCAYCECNLQSVNYVEIDNFRPKSGSRDLNGNFAHNHYYWLAYDWINLYPVCQFCSKFKSDLFPIEEGFPRAVVGANGKDLLSEHALLIDPCQDDPEIHLNFLQDGMVEGLTKKGSVTIEVLSLNRPDLVAERKKVLLEEMHRLSQYQYEVITLPGDDFRKTIIRYFSEPGGEHLAVRRSAIKRWKDENPGPWKSLTQDLDLSRYRPLPVTYEMPLSQPVNADDISNIKDNLQSVKRFTIKSIEIKNFRTISEMYLDILPSDSLSERESWLLLLGDNGTGKSSILQAVAVTLAGQDQLNKLKIEPSDFLRKGTTEGSIKIHCYEMNEPVTLTFNAKTFHIDLKSAPTFILGYGSTRLLPKGNLKPAPGQNADINISNLFDYSISLTDVNEWLAGVPPDEFNQRIAPALFDLLDLEDSEKVVFTNGKLCVEQFTGSYGLEKISDGFKGVIGLACDMMKTLAADSAGYHTVQGIVLIDELGNHLHPRWRMKIVEALRKTFPKLQFIVSTHEPLCLRGLLHGEVVVLVEDETYSVRALDKSLLPDHNLLRVDQLLTSDLFGLINTLDAGMEKKYEAYYKLLSKPEERRDAEDLEMINQYSREIADKEIIGSTPQLQAMYRLVNESFAQQIRDDGFKTKSAIKEDTIQQIQDKIKDIDWL